MYVAHVPFVIIHTPEAPNTKFTRVRLFMGVAYLHMPFKSISITEISVITAFRISTFIA